MTSQPTRQLSLQQPPKRTQVRRQRSADDNRSHGGNHYHSDQAARSRREKNNWGFMEKPKVRIAWTSQMEDSKVEVIASRIGTSSASKSGRGHINCASSSVMSGDKATILYSRQELAERLRLAWKQREANKSNIDIFLAHDTTAEERCDSRLSSSSCVDAKGMDDERNTRLDELERSSEVENCAPEVNEERGKIKGLNEKEAKANLAADARAKRAGFQSGMNVAFNGPAQKNTLVSPVIRDMRERGNGLVDARSKRTNSAPPLQRRGLLSSPGNPGPSNRPRVNIIIDTPKMGRARDFANSLAPFKFERKDSSIQGKSSALSSPHEDTPKNPTIPVIQVAAASSEKPKIGNKKRARSGKRRVDDNGRKSELSKTNPDVVTMVSLVSDADSDSEVEKNSPRDDKLVRQLRTNLTTTPIIKTCSPLMMSTGNLSTGNLDNCGSNALMPRRVLKSVSFQQDSIDGELHLRPRSADRKSFSPDIQAKLMISQGNSLIRSSAEEMRTAWQEISSTNLEIPSLPTQNYWDDSLEVTQTLTDREKRCLVVPIGDSQDKKRKLLLQRTKSVPVRTDSTEERHSTALQMETKEPSSSSSLSLSSSSSSSRPEVREQAESINNGRVVPAASMQTSIAKFIEGDSFRMSEADLEAVELNIEDIEPHLRTTKEKECWHLYRRMCDKGVCVSFDTVLRGMLTPTEYRLRRREPT